MNCIKKISVTGYRVQFVDLREPKPRTPREEIYTMDKDWLDALGLFHLDPVDTIKARYEKAGYRVFNVTQIKPKRCVAVDLTQMFLDAIEEEALPSDQ